MHNKTFNTLSVDLLGVLGGVGPVKLPPRRNRPANQPPLGLVYKTQGIVN